MNHASKRRAERAETPGHDASYLPDTKRRPAFFIFVPSLPYEDRQEGVGGKLAAG